MTNIHTVSSISLGSFISCPGSLFFSFPYGVAIYQWPTENSPWPMVVPKPYLKSISYWPVQKLHKGYSKMNHIQ